MKRYLLAVLAVFVTWSALDFLCHGVILQSTYAATASLWRPMPEMKMGLMRLVTLVSAACFTGIYWALVNPKSSTAGLKYGLLFGLGAGFAMGFGTYSYMPVPLFLSLVWFGNALVQAQVAGAIVSAIIKD
jgi:hypothetical protein